MSPEVEEASGGIYRTQHTLIVRRRNSVDNEPDIALDLLDDATFKKALTAMGIPEDDIPVLARASGQSPTILRRHLSEVPAIKSPPWAQDGELTRKLVPLGFAGVWHSQTSADQEILSYLSDDPYEVVERSVTELLRSEQCPVWSVGRYRGVSSKLDVLYGVHRLVTSQDLEKFFFIARIVSQNVTRHSICLKKKDTRPVFTVRRAITQRRCVTVSAKRSWCSLYTETISSKTGSA